MPLNLKFEAMKSIFLVPSHEKNKEDKCVRETEKKKKKKKQ